MLTPLLCLQGITGSKMEKVCDAVHITLNKNSVHGDRSAVTPGGVRIGSVRAAAMGLGLGLGWSGLTVALAGLLVVQPALTTRGLKEADFITVCDFACPTTTANALTNVSVTQIADFLERAAKLAVKVQNSAGKMLKNFVPALETDEEVAVRCPHACACGSGCKMAHRVTLVVCVAGSAR